MPRKAPPHRLDATAGHARPVAGPSPGTATGGRSPRQVAALAIVLGFAAGLLGIPVATYVAGPFTGATGLGWLLSVVLPVCASAGLLAVVARGDPDSPGRLAVALAAAAGLAAASLREPAPVRPAGTPA